MSRRVGVNESLVLRLDVLSIFLKGIAQMGL
jgi:hypothetical protein